MPLARWWPRLIPLPGNPWIGAVDVDPREWLAIASDVAAAGGQLLALWTTLEHGTDVHATVRAALRGLRATCTPRESLMNQLSAAASFA